MSLDADFLYDGVRHDVSHRVVFNYFSELHPDRDDKCVLECQVSLEELLRLHEMLCERLYKARVAEDAVCAEDQISRIFQPGNVYTAAYIKEYLQSLNIPNAKATTLSRWYVIKRITKNGVACYRIISRLVDNL